MIVIELRQSHSLPALLKVSGLARSTFYYQQKVLGGGDRYAELKTKVQAIYHRHKGRYGYRRITATIRGMGQVVNHKTIQRVMRLLSLKSLVRPKRYRSYKGIVGGVAPDLLKRQFKAQRPNQKWVTDITEFNVGGEKLYLSPVMDLFNGEIVAYQIAQRPTFDLVCSMLRKSLAKLPKQDKPLLHSDQGWHYQMSAFRRILDHHGLTQSMSRRGNCLDNAAMESFFGILKSELFELDRCTSIGQLHAELVRYIYYYNHDRIKLKLQGLSPVQYRAQFAAA